MNKWYIIEGNIGSGKSTILNILESKSKYEVIPEPVHLWTSIKDDKEINLLQHFYSNMDRYSYMFQTMVFKTRLEALDKPQLKDIRFSERSILTDRYVFGKMCMEDNKMNSIESSCYKYWFEWLSTKFNSKPSGIIYVKCSPEKCYERIKKRNRNEESDIPLDYLNKLNKYHDDWLLNWTETPTLIIDNDKDEDYENILNQIKSFIGDNEKKTEPELVYSYFE